MGIRHYKPTSPGRRGMTSTQDFGEITKEKPEKSLLEHKTRRAAATTTAASPRASAAAATSSATA